MGYVEISPDPSLRLSTYIVCENHWNKLIPDHDTHASHRPVVWQEDIRIRSAGFGPAYIRRRRLDKALKAAKAKVAWSQIRGRFPLSGLDGCSPLPTNWERLRHHEIARHAVDKYDEDDCAGIFRPRHASRHAGVPEPQRRSWCAIREGALVGRTYGQTKDQKGTTFLSSYARTLTNGSLRFHTDRTDVVGLLCVARPRSGVSTLRASYWSTPWRDGPTCSMSCSVSTGAAASARKARPRRPPIPCRSSACATASSPRTIR
jgi:hypothetical protein